MGFNDTFISIRALISAIMAPARCETVSWRRSADPCTAKCKFSAVLVPTVAWLMHWCPTFVADARSLVIGEDLNLELVNVDDGVLICQSNRCDFALMWLLTKKNYCGRSAISQQTDPVSTWFRERQISREIVSGFLLLGPFSLVA